MIEPVGGEAHDLLVHAILHGEERHHLGLLLHDALHERLAQPALQSLIALHRGRQLTMVAGEDHAPGTANGNPAGCFKRLCGLVDEQRAELHAVQQAVGRADKSGGDDSRLAEELLVDGNLQGRSTVFQALHLLMPFLVAPLTILAQLADGLANGPQLRIVGMRLETTLVGEGQHLIVYPRGIAYAEHVQATVYKFLRNPVDSHVTLRTDQHLVLATQRLVDSLNECGRLARTGRAVNDGHVLGPQHLVDGVFLRAVEIRKVHVGKGESLCPHATGIEEVAEIAQTALGPHRALQRLEHHPIGGLVKTQLHANLSLGCLQVDNRGVVGQGNHHAVAVDVGNGALKRKVKSGE